MWAKPTARADGQWFACLGVTCLGIAVLCALSASGQEEPGAPPAFLQPELHTLPGSKVDFKGRQDAARSQVDSKKRDNASPAVQDNRPAAKGQVDGPIITSGTKGTAQEKTKRPEPFTLPGSVVPARLVRVTSAVRGQVTKVRVNVGDVVKAGDVLVDIDGIRARLEV